MYKFLRSILFWFDPEKIHYFSMGWLERLTHIPLAGKYFAKRFSVNDARLYKTAFGIDFKNPIGLAAGFDKNACYLDELEKLGFGHVEIGTVTPRAQDGNEHPRLFRLPEDKALLNRMGFNNDGVEVVAERLRNWHLNLTRAARDGKSNGSHRLIIGGNIGKNKSTPNEYAYMDYDICFRKLHDYVDYFVVNVSSPNTPGLRELQEKESLRKILTHLQEINFSLSSVKPILLKIAPDLSNAQLNDVIALALEIKLDGLVASNTTLDRTKLSDAGKIRAGEAGAGGVSGKPVQQRSTEMVRIIHEQTNGKIPVIASGGVFTASDAKEKFEAGAALVQVWTGFIYEGPAIVKNICKELRQ
jgi:dihydroorotate dehydrogenase